MTWIPVVLRQPVCAALALPLILFSCSGSNKIEYRLNPEPQSHLVFIGNTFAERLQFYNYFEPLIYKSYPGKNLVIRNLGWSADEINLRSRPLNFPSQDSLLREQKADIIFACYGLNESFKGTDSLASFKENLSAHLQHIRQQKYNGKNHPEIILVSPVAYEALDGALPEADTNNKNIALYTRTMRDVAKELKIPFLDLFAFTKKLQNTESPITINGIHLNEKGYRLVSEWMAGSLGLPVANREQDESFLNLKKIIDQKNQQFYYLYRAVNSEYIRGRRKEPWVQPPGGPVSFPSELAKLSDMVVRMDSVVWKESRKNSVENFEAAGKILNDTIQYLPLKKDLLDPPSVDQFILPEGFEINLFASEVDFSISNPVKITFDPKGRLWVANMESYPQYLPGAQPNDKIIILEDTDGDGSADKETIFADSLYLPTGFELGKGGIYVSQPPNVWFMKDTDGDDKADEKEIILHGFGTEDVHHTLDTYTWGPDGALYWHTGTFLHSQVETPFGPQRGDYGITWRFEPATQKLEPYVSYPYANPWGHVFLKNGTEIIGDVSTGMNYFAPPLTVAVSYPRKLTEMKDFLTSQVKPKTCGLEIISSRQFPDSMQGNILFNTFIGFQGIRQHRLQEEGSGITAQETTPLLQSKDPNFRPVDLQFGPDGALYVVDWYNPIINHGERALRDPLRDHVHGRIWRITCKNKELLKRIDLTTLSMEALLDQLKEKEARLHYRVRTRLRQSDEKTVIPALKKWIASLDRNDPDFDQYRLEGLWVCQQFNHPDKELLESLLQSEDEYVRTAATRVLFYWSAYIKGAEEKLIALSLDSSPKVRLQAIIALSHFNTERSVIALLATTSLPVDYYTRYALKASFRHLQPVWLSMFRKNKSFLADDAAKAAWLLGSLSDPEELKMPGFFSGDPEKGKYSYPALDSLFYEAFNEAPAVARFRKTLAEKNGEKDLEATSRLSEKVILRLSALPGKMQFDRPEITVKAGSNITLIFQNNDNMPHNLVISKPGTLEKVGKYADGMAALPDGYQKNFVPDIPEVLFATPLINAGKDFSLDMKVPEREGKYPFLCSFPGHWQTMRGVMKVIK